MMTAHKINKEGKKKINLKAHTHTHNRPIKNKKNQQPQNKNKQNKQAKEIK